MPTRFEILAEAERRGLLRPEDAPILAEARRRGMVPPAESAPAPEPDKPGILSRAKSAAGSVMDALFTPPEFVQRARERLDQRKPTISQQVARRYGVEQPIDAEAFLRDVVFGSATPGDALMLLGSGGTSAIARVATPVARGLSAALGVRGAHRAVTGDTAAERVGGAAEALFGGLGARSAPTPAKRTPPPGIVLGEGVDLPPERVGDMLMPEAGGPVRVSPEALRVPRETPEAMSPLDALLIPDRLEAKPPAAPTPHPPAPAKQPAAAVLSAAPTPHPPARHPPARHPPAPPARADAPAKQPAGVTFGKRQKDVTQQGVRHFYPIMRDGKQVGEIRQTKGGTDRPGMLWTIVRDGKFESFDSVREAKAAVLSAAPTPHPPARHPPAPPARADAPAKQPAGVTFGKRQKDVTQQGVRHFYPIMRDGKQVGEIRQTKGGTDRPGMLWTIVRDGKFESFDSVREAKAAVLSAAPTPHPPARHPPAPPARADAPAKQPAGVTFGKRQKDVTQQGVRHFYPIMRDGKQVGEIRQTKGGTDRPGMLWTIVRDGKFESFDSVREAKAAVLSAAPTPHPPARHPRAHPPAPPARADAPAKQPAGVTFGKRQKDVTQQGVRHFYPIMRDGKQVGEIRQTKGGTDRPGMLWTIVRDGKFESFDSVREAKAAVLSAAPTPPPHAPLETPAAIDAEAVLTEMALAPRHARTTRTGTVRRWPRMKPLPPALLSSDERAMLERMKLDMEENQFQPSGLDATGEWHHREAGSGVAHDILGAADNKKATVAEAWQAVEDVLAGKKVTNRLHLGALRAMRGYIDESPEYQGLWRHQPPDQPPDEAAEEFWAAMDDAANEIPAGAGSGTPDIQPGAQLNPASRPEFVSTQRGRYSVRQGGEEIGTVARDADGRWVLAADGEERAFDSVADVKAVVFGDAGKVNPRLLARVGLGGTGAATGAAQGEDTEDKLWKAGVYGAVGFVLPGYVRGSAVRSRSARAAQTEAKTEPAAATLASGGARAPVSGPMAKGDTTRMSTHEQRWLKQFPQPLADHYEGVIAANLPEVRQQVRGVVSHTAAAEAASELKVIADEVFEPGTALNKEGMYAVAAAIRKQANEVGRLAKVATADGATDLDQLRLAQADQRLKNLQLSGRGAVAEAGRALGGINELKVAIETSDPTIIARTADGLRKGNRELREWWDTLPTDPHARYRALQERSKRPFGWDTIRNYYYANILSGVKTHLRNLVGNTANTIWNIGTIPVAAGMDALRVAARGGDREVFFREIGPQVYGAAQGLNQGVRDALFTFRYGMQPEVLKGAVDAVDAGKFDFVHTEFAGGGANPFNWPSRGLAAGDAVFRNIARYAERGGAAYAMARREGLKGDALKKRIADLQAGDTPDSRALIERSEEFATRAVFQESGEITDALRQLTRVPVLAQVMTFSMPFIRTPGNILRQGLESSPAGFAMKAARQGGRAGAQAQGRAAAGTAAVLGLAWMAHQGILSGAGPKDRAARDRLYETGWRPNSVKIGDTWVSYQLMQPLSVPASIIANTFEAVRDAKDDEERATIVATAAARAGNSFLDQSFLVGMFDLASAVQDPERFAPRLFARTATGMVPFSGALRGVQQSTDPTIRQPEGFGENVLAAFPGLSTGIEPRIGRRGQTLTRPQGAWSGVDPFNVSPAVPPDAVARELEATGVRLGAPSGRLTLPDGRSLTRGGETAVKQEQGQALWRVLETVVQSPVYRALNVDQRRAVLERVIAGVRPRVNEQLRATLPSAHVQ